MRPPLVILAGGRGTRLHSITKDEIPKPMVDVFGKPFLYWLIEHYVEQGFTDITISTGHKADIIEKYPWPWKLKFKRDTLGEPYEVFYDAEECCHNWVVNGDTWIKEELPRASSGYYIDLHYNPIIVCHNDVDAGAHYVCLGKTKLYKTHTFYDIGTPDGLERFKEYFKTHLYKE